MGAIKFIFGVLFSVMLFLCLVLATNTNATIADYIQTNVPVVTSQINAVTPPVVDFLRTAPFAVFGVVWGVFLLLFQLALLALIIFVVPVSAWKRLANNIGEGLMSLGGEISKKTAEPAEVQQEQKSNDSVN